MIKPTELRIGNWVIIKDDARGNYTYEITAHDLEEMESFEDDYKNNGVLPIPLTPEILEKCGFVWNESIKHWTITWGKNGVHFIKKDNYYSDNSFSFELGKGRYKIINFLHQLQNLYFALTEQELEINLHVAATI